MTRFMQIFIIAFYLLRACNGFMSALCINNSSSTRRNIIILTPQQQNLAESRINNNNLNSFKKIKQSSSLAMVSSNDIVDIQTSLIIAETESWRQYVPLVVTFGVILDIVLGSPLANMALGPMRKAAMENEDNDSTEEMNDINSGGENKSKFNRNPKERVDSEAIGLAALETARAKMELRKFLEENKTDEQRYEEIRKKIDSEAAKFDAKIRGD